MTHEVLCVPGSIVDVLTEPLTAAEYCRQHDRGLNGEITRNVSLDIQALVERDYDTLVDQIAEKVVSELGEAWQLRSYRLIGLDPRQDGTTDAGSHGIFAVTIDPDIPADFLTNGWPS